MDTRCSVDGRKRLVRTRIVLKMEQNSAFFIWKRCSVEVLDSTMETK